MPANKLLLAALLAGAAVFPASAAAEEEELEGLSRGMRQGIHFYEQREDGLAMERFMEVLTRGEPSERALANEYLNLITQRMNSGGKSPEAPAASVAKPRLVVPSEPAPPRSRSSKKQIPEPPREEAPKKEEVVVEADDLKPVPVRRPRSEAAEEDEPPQPQPRKVKVDKALMAVEIRAKIRSRREGHLKRLKETEDIQVVLLENGDPQAVGIPTPLFFQSGTSFQKGAGPILEDLAGLAYTLSGAQILVLPEGTAVGDAKVLDMRRTMGISAHLYSAGIAPARVKVNLLNNQIEIPKALRDFKGIMILFAYNQPINLVVESPIADSAGPPLSLGVYPPGLDPAKDEGVIVEFSVQDPPSGLVSWKFQLLQPAVGEDELAPLQEVLGGGPVFHQIYWNARKNYFGGAMPPGRYECVLTATDGKNRQRTLHRWIQVAEPPASRAAAPVAGAPPRGAGAPKAELGGAGMAPLLSGAGPKAPAAKPRRSRRSRRSAPEAAAPAGGEGESGKSFAVDFSPEQADLPAEASAVLEKAAKAALARPDSRIELMGYAHSAEPEAAALAQKRAQAVAGALINQYKVEPARVQVRSAVAESPVSQVQIRIASG